MTCALNDVVTFCLFGLRLYVPVNNFQSCRDGATASWVLPVLFWEVNVSCSRIQHGDPSEDPTPNLSLPSPTIYHQATSPPDVVTRLTSPWGLSRKGRKKESYVMSYSTNVKKLHMDHRVRIPGSDYKNLT